MAFKRFFSTFLILLCAYVVVNFLCLPHNHLISHPLYMDDYKALSLTYDVVSWKHPRPVIYFLGPLFAKLGIAGFYCLVLAGIIAAASIVLFFIEQFFLIPLTNRWIFFYGICLFSFPFILFASKFLGIVINLCSIIFGTSSLIFLLKAHRTNRTLHYMIAGCLYLLTLYTKEDFILPNFLLIFYCLFLEPLRDTGLPRSLRDLAMTKKPFRNGGMLYYLIFSLLAVLSLVLFNKFIALSPFTQGGENYLNPYAVNLHPVSVLKISLEYLTCHIYLSFTFLLAIILSLLLLRGHEVTVTIQKIALIWGIIFLLILPYAILPNHVTLFYIYNWLPWEIGLISICLMQKLSHKSLKFQLIIMIILSVVFMSISFQHRYHNAIMVEAQSRINKNIANTLKRYQVILNQQTQPIGVIGKGVEGFSPWRVSQAEYIQNNLHIKAKWVVFTTTHSAEVQKNFDPNLWVNTLDIGKLQAFKKIPLLYFDADGNGTYQSRDRKGAPTTLKLK